MRRALAWLSALTATACVQLGSGPSHSDVAGEGEIPFTLAGAGGAAIVVPVHVLDTGATFTCLDQSLAERLELPKPVGMVGFGATLGQSGPVTLHRIETLEVGPVRAARLTACALDLRGVNKLGLGVQGLLGLNFLKAFRVTLDFKRQVMSLTQL
jgi:hypothetical protein